TCFRISTNYKPGMRVPGIIYADDELIQMAEKDHVLEQVANVAFLPGVVKASFAMPDIHWGYGFPIGGVAAMDVKTGVISPGGVGYDISCGVRLIKTNLLAKEVTPLMQPLMHELSRNIPKGVGSRGKIKAGRKEMERLVTEGASWAVKVGYGWEEDLEYTEERGCLNGANPDMVSARAFERGADQPGTLGSGNHFLELQEVMEIFDEKVARVFGLYKGQLVIMIHSGSRGAGHQICTDYIKVMDRVVRELGIELPDRQLGCAPIASDEGKAYYAAMACAANYAITNRHCLGHWLRGSFEHILKKSAEKLGMHLLYDVSHNIAQFEDHEIDSKTIRLCVHRKGATRSFGPGHPDLPLKYREVGQPVIIPGDMGRASYILVGTEASEKEAFSSTCHGAGRMMSRSQAKRQIRGDQLKRELEGKGIVIMAGHLPLLAEEAPQAYKDVSKVVEICHEAGLSKKVAKMRPLGVLKG
ncbi:MAG: RtcB family protein, partial [Candidatus Subteraquimicrobiales bacterium]|nr:RtcB family protein [Candidatus Subteraquimicrobiales bacterium]